MDLSISSWQSSRHIRLVNPPFGMPTYGAPDRSAGAGKAAHCQPPSDIHGDPVFNVRAKFILELDEKLTRNGPAWSVWVSLVPSTGLFLRFSTVRKFCRRSSYKRRFLSDNSAASRPRRIATSSGSKRARVKSRRMRVANRFGDPGSRNPDWTAASSS